MIFKDRSFPSAYKNVLQIYDIFNIYKNTNNKTPSFPDILTVTIKEIENIADTIPDV